MTYTKAFREEITSAAISRSVRGASLRQIGDEFGVPFNTIRNWLNDEYARRAEHREQEREKAIATYEELKAERWRRLAQLSTDSKANNVVGLLNGINADQERIDKLTGAEAPIKYESEGRVYVVSWDEAEAEEHAES